MMSIDLNVNLARNPTLGDKNHESPLDRFADAPEFPAFPLNNFYVQFTKTLNNEVKLISEEAKNSQFKATLLKVAFIGLLVLGLICAASFCLLPIAGQIAAAVGATVSTVLITCEAIFVAGGLIAGLSFVPRSFIQKYTDQKEQAEEKAEKLKSYIENRVNMEQFIKEELILRDFKKPLEVIASRDFVELYYTIQSLKAKKSQMASFLLKMDYVNHLLIPVEQRSEENEYRQQELEEQLTHVSNSIQDMQKEVHELELQADEIRVKLLYI